MDHSKDNKEVKVDMPESCKLAEQHQTDPLLDQVAEQHHEELGYALPVMGELYNETSHGDPAESILSSDECQCDSGD